MQLTILLIWSKSNIQAKIASAVDVPEYIFLMNSSVSPSSSSLNPTIGVTAASFSFA